MTERVTVSDMLAEMDAGWESLAGYVGTLNDDQRTKKTDAAGWTVKDHLMHLAQWHLTLPALLDGKSRAEALGVTEALWEEVVARRDDSAWDAINAVIQLRYKDVPYDEVMRRLRETYESNRARVAAMTDDDLNLPYKHYQPTSSNERPVYYWVFANTIDHYVEHLPWIKAIAGE